MTTKCEHLDTVQADAFVTKVHFSFTPERPRQLLISICPIAAGGGEVVFEVFFLQLMKFKLKLKTRKKILINLQLFKFISKF